MTPEPSALFLYADGLVRRFPDIDWAPTVIVRETEKERKPLVRTAATVFRREEVWHLTFKLARVTRRGDRLCRTYRQTAEERYR